MSDLQVQYTAFVKVGDEGKISTVGISALLASRYAALANKGYVLWLANPTRWVSASLGTPLDGRSQAGGVSVDIHLKMDADASQADQDAAFQRIVPEIIDAAYDTFIKGVQS